jgi:GNAT superfamily N-acetyltransferase
MNEPGEHTEHPLTKSPARRLETTARSAFADHVRVYDSEDQVIVHVEPEHLRLVYLSVRASRQANSATFIQCRIDHSGSQMWITSLQVCDSLRRQGLGREMVDACEATAKAIGMESIRVYPLTGVAEFWESLGYQPDSRMSRVLRKEIA